MSTLVPCVIAVIHNLTFPYLTENIGTDLCAYMYGTSTQTCDIHMYIPHPDCFSQHFLAPSSSSCVSYPLFTNAFNRSMSASSRRIPIQSVMAFAPSDFS